MATLLLDLLTESEDARDRVTGEFRFDIILLAKRLVLARSWCAQREDLKPLPAGYFGASTGAAAALVAAAGRNDVEAIVSRGGRPDLAGVALADVRAATLLIVGERDETVLQLNRDAAAKMNAHNEIAIVPSATHLFEEPGALERVGELARAWFSRYLRF
jgi:putative phosphoribosyl transferase